MVIYRGIDLQNKVDSGREGIIVSVLTNMELDRR